MAKIEGIIYKVFENYVVVRGYAPIGQLAKVSHRPEVYQREPDDKHKRDIIRYLEKGVYTYFPEIILAHQADDLAGLIDLLHGEDDIDFEAEKYISGLKVLKERVPWGGNAGNRARHAYINLEDKQLARVDGNHRLAPFSSKLSWWWGFIDEEEPEGYTEEELKQWKNQKIKPFKKRIEEIIVPYSIVISDKTISDKFEAAIFNNINFKALPLKQEKNLQNIYNLLKESDELGDAHKLTMDLIELSEKQHFKGLVHLTPINNDKDVYRTACLKISTILLEKKKTIEASKEIEKIENKLGKIIEEVNKKSPEADKLTEVAVRLSKISGKSKEEVEKVQLQADNSQREVERLRRKERKFRNELKRLKTYCENCTNIDHIEIAIQSLRFTYSKMQDRSNGNLSMLAALVYYKLLDESKFNSFVDWIMRNGIHKIPVSDYLPSHNANSLIALFERIYEAKAKEIFISMQFGDPQSEMIYEKVVQTIERFNIIKGLDISITPIRVDQTVKPHAFSIPDEILRAIESSSLIIADLSSANLNVYHEIGYAMGISQAKGIEPPVILLYKNDTVFKKDGADGDKFVGFNLRGTTQLRFSTYKELMDQLTKKLEVQFEV